MRVLYASRGYSPHDHRFISALNASGEEIHFLGFNRSHRLETRPIPDALAAVSWLGDGERRGPVAQLQVLRRLRSLLAEIQPDVVHAGPIQAVAFYFALLGVHPLVSMSWGSDLLLGGRRGWGRLAARFTLKRSDVLLCDADIVKRMAQSIGFAGEDVVVFPWGVDLERFRPGRSEEVRRELGWEGAFVFLSSRNWEPIYGVDTVLEAFIQVVQRAPQARLLLIGSGSLEQALRARIRESGAADKIALIGGLPYADLPRYYQSADVYVSGSHSDGSSVSLLEAMACGLVVLVTDIPGNLEWVAAETQGATFPPGDVDTLAEVMHTMLGQPERWAGAEAQNRRIVLERADWTRNVQKLTEAYAIALGTARGA